MNGEPSILRHLMGPPIEADQDRPWSWRRDTDGEIELFLHRHPSSYSPVCHPKNARETLELINKELQKLLPEGCGARVYEHSSGLDEAPNERWFIQWWTSSYGPLKELEVKGNLASRIGEVLSWIAKTTNRATPHPPFDLDRAIAFVANFREDIYAQNPEDMFLALGKFLAEDFQINIDATKEPDHPLLRAQALLREFLVRQRHYACGIEPQRNFKLLAEITFELRLAKHLQKAGK